MKISPLTADRKTRTIVFSFDEKYAKYFSVVLSSLIAHADTAFLYDLIVLHDSLSDRTVEQLQAFVPEGFVLRFFDAGSCAAEYFGSLSDKVSSRQYDVSTFYDLLVPLIMSDYERVLYCDSDMVFCADPGELFEMPFEGRELIAVRDSLSLISAMRPDNIYVQKQADLAIKTLGISDLEDYFNAGVLMFNIPAINTDAYLKKVREALDFPWLPTVDQDVLNYVFRGKVLQAPLRFNLQAQVLNDLEEKDREEEAYREALRDPVIIHYASFAKPWKRPGCVLAEYFWPNAERSPFYEEILRENYGDLRIGDQLSGLKYLLFAALSLLPHGKRQRGFQRLRDKHRRTVRMQRGLRGGKGDRASIFR